MVAIASIAPPSDLVGALALNGLNSFMRKVLTRRCRLYPAAATRTASARNDATGVRWTKRKIPSLFVNTAKICFWRCSRTRKKRKTPPKTTKHRQILSIFAHLSVNTPISGVHEQKMSVNTPKNGGGFREHKFHWGGRSS